MKKNRDMTDRKKAAHEKSGVKRILKFLGLLLFLGGAVTAIFMYDFTKNFISAMDEELGNDNS